MYDLTLEGYAQQLRRPAATCDELLLLLDTFNNACSSVLSCIHPPKMFMSEQTMQ